MTPPTITNSLLRLDRVTGEPPAPFERPNEKMNFFVLELGLHDDLGSWCDHVSEIIRTHAELLGKMCAAGAEATLFVECAASVPVLRFDSPFLRVLSQADISIEFSHEA